MNTIDSRNDGHGHVTPRPDGYRSRCGGPAMCAVCQRERAAFEATQPPQDERCPTCGENEPRTGTCGTSDDDTRAFCKRRHAASAPAQQAEESQYRDNNWWLGWNAAIRSMQATTPQPVAAEVAKPVWASCQTRGPWVRNSLRTRLNALLEDEERIRHAYSKPFMAEPSAFIADSYAEAAEVFASRLAALSGTGSDESKKGEV